VEDITLQIAPGETLGLLGSNGAGKSTLISMLSAAFPPSGGDAWVDGHHVERATRGVLQSLGICYQHERLWEDLTVAEHILFYSRLKGVLPQDEARAIHQSLAAVNLESVRDRPAGALSGGMRRRLAVAISLAGRSRAVFLDEPSTGLDPASKRQLWTVIERARDEGRRSADTTGRAIVLTTHLMDEAELLSTRIAIVTHGRVRVLGTQQELKSRFGHGYRLHAGFDEDAPGARDAVIAFVARTFPDAAIDADFRGYLSFLLPETAGVRVSDVFERMRASAHACPAITQWGAGQVTLEDVFARVVRAYRGAGAGEEGQDAAEDRGTA
jgi:ABC-type multidrug transport system ATPase subunit